ncbi:M14 family zinc carboxypeptidase [Pedobacter sp. SAFR-022]|uniref:M14 family zinc carboxypeptidase n=1 Tax=Pedobacter sp. SAFR-022 TaxID=3436861 RepID=UPI003F809934
MKIDKILESYDSFRESGLEDRFFKHQDLMRILDRHSGDFNTELAGHSLEGREIRLLTVGTGPCKVFLWSQMHGDETTGTMALMDLLNFLKHQAGSPISTLLLSACTLYLLPMVNPDGAERFSRRNAQQIDINRDYLRAASAEAKVLKAMHEKIKPSFGFNLHDQSNLWGVKNSTYPAALSFLAPAFDEPGSLNDNRGQAIQVIACIKDSLLGMLPGKIGLFDDTFEPRAFGDNFQKAGTATILIEGGSIIGDRKFQEVRKMVFAAILAGLSAISSASYLQNTTDNYLSIPKNTKSLFHILICDVFFQGIRTSIGINYEPVPTSDGNSIECFYSIEDIGDLSTMNAYQVYQADKMQIYGDIVYDCPADFDLVHGTETILSFKQGILQSK